MVLASTALGPSAFAQSSVLKIGVISNLTGPGATWGLPIDGGARIAAQEVNDRGGLNVGGKRLQIEVVSYAHVEDILDLTGLAPHRDLVADTLPYGAQKVLGVAMALAARPRLLLADEPAAGLNGAETEQMEELLRAIHARGIAVIVVEHDLRLVMRLSERVVVLAQGEVVADGPPDVVRRDPRFIEVYLGGGDVAA